MNHLIKTLSVVALLALGGLSLTACEADHGSDAEHGHSHD